MDAEDYRAASQDIRALASKMKCAETRAALHSLADAYEILAEYVRATPSPTSGDEPSLERRGPRIAVVADTGEKSPSTR